MENPERDIEGVIKSLTEGTRKEQRNAVNEYFLPDAFFVHPFCRVPSFSYKRYIPYINVQLKITSRLFILLIYQWYKILSPKIKLEVLSTCKSAFSRGKEKEISAKHPPKQHCTQPEWPPFPPRNYNEISNRTVS